MQKKWKQETFCRKKFIVALSHSEVEEESVCVCHLLLAQRRRVVSAIMEVTT